MKDEGPYLCPLCKGVMTILQTGTGIKVRCDNPCLPTCHENVFGHGKNAKEAWQIAKEKFGH
jgi:hypothetical protein